MKLIAEVKDAELLFKMVHALGTTFYRVCGSGEYEVVYFSGERIVHFVGRLSGDQVRCLEASGWRVSEIVVDEVLGEVRVRQ